MITMLQSKWEKQRTGREEDSFHYTCQQGGWVDRSVGAAGTASAAGFRTSNGQRGMWLLGQHTHAAITLHKEHETSFCGSVAVSPKETPRSPIC